MPLATSSPLVMPPKMLMKIDRTFGSLLMTSSAPAITSALAPPPMSRKLAGLPPTWLTMSTRAHREPGAVGDDADGAVEADVLQALARAPPARASSRTWVASYSLVVGVAEHRVVVEGDLGVERVHLAVGREDQRVDLDEVGVALDVGACRASAGCRPRRRWPAGSSFAASTHARHCASVEPVDRDRSGSWRWRRGSPPRPPRSRRRPAPTACRGAAWPRGRA